MSNLEELLWVITKDLPEGTTVRVELLLTKRGKKFEASATNVRREAA